MYISIIYIYQIYEIFSHSLNQNEFLFNPLLIYNIGNQP